MSFFSNKDLNFLNVHYGLRAMGWEMCAMFTLSYVYKQGLSLPLTFAVYAALLFTRTLTRPLAMYLCLKKGVHWTLMVGTAVFATRYPAMMQVDGLNWNLLPFIVASGLSDVLYWVPYHNYFASVGDEQDRGSSVGIRDAIATVVAVLGPLLGGALLTIDKFYAFLLPFVLTLVALIPLSKTPNLPLPKRASHAEKKSVDRFGFIVFIGDGLFYQASAIWPLVVFMILGENFAEFGFILALAAVFRAIGSMFFGRLIDKGRGRQICYIGYGLHILVLTVRGFFAYSIPVIIICDFFAAIAYCFSMTGLMTAVYNATKKAENPLYFTYYTELGWDVGAVTAMIIPAIMTAMGVDVRWGLSVAVAGALVTVAALHRYYMKQRRLKKLAALDQLAIIDLSVS